MGIKERLFGKKLLIAMVLLWMLGVGLYQTGKTLPAGIDFQGKTRFVPLGDITFLRDLTYRGADGQTVYDQEIFDTIFSHLATAETDILLDMFLFNSYQAASVEVPRDLAGELTDLLVSKKQASPEIRIDLITDPINTVYGGGRSAEIETLEKAGINVILTDLRSLRDSNPAYSVFWRTFVQWFGNSNEGGFLPHPFSDRQAGVTLRSYLEMMNFKANHRKIVIADGAEGQVTIVTSANPHTASSAHSNVALLIRDDLWRDGYETEKSIARLSRSAVGRRPELRHRPLPHQEEQLAAVVLVTESRIKEQVLSVIDECGEGDSLWLAMFYLSDRDVISALLEADRRGAQVRIVLDPNRDAFGFEKNGIPNRPVARELVEKSGGTISIRWYRTQGEQFHSKMVFLDREDSGATVILGSANLTRRNLDGFNLELDVRVDSVGSLPPMSDIRDYLERIWYNRDGRYTVDYPEFADESFWKKVVYRLQEFTGFCSY